VRTVERLVSRLWPRTMTLHWFCARAMALAPSAWTSRIAAAQVTEFTRSLLRDRLRGRRGLLPRPRSGRSRPASCQRVCDRSACVASFSIRLAQIGGVGCHQGANGVATACCRGDDHSTISTHPVFPSAGRRCPARLCATASFRAPGAFGLLFRWCDVSHVTSSGLPGRRTSGL
jgi:hypothetical protein